MAKNITEIPEISKMKMYYFFYKKIQVSDSPTTHGHGNKILDNQTLIFYLFFLVRERKKLEERGRDGGKSSDATETGEGGERKSRAWCDWLRCSCSKGNIFHHRCKGKINFLFSSLVLPFPFQIFPIFKRIVC